MTMNKLASAKAFRKDDRAAEIDRESTERELLQHLAIFQALHDAVHNKDGTPREKGVSRSLQAAYEGSLIRVNAAANAYVDAWGDASGD